MKSIYKTEHGYLITGRIINEYLQVIDNLEVKKYKFHDPNIQAEGIKDVLVYGNINGNVIIPKRSFLIHERSLKLKADNTICFVLNDKDIVLKKKSQNNSILMQCLINNRNYYLEIDEKDRLSQIIYPVFIVTDVYQNEFLCSEIYHVENLI